MDYSLKYLYVGLFSCFFFVICALFSKLVLIKKIRNTTDLIHIIMSFQILVQTIFKGYQQMTKVATSKTSVNRDIIQLVDVLQAKSDSDVIFCYKVIRD